MGPFETIGSIDPLGPYETIGSVTEEQHWAYVRQSAAPLTGSAGPI
jgi:hypothetical protein